jgi:hypothetical protein
MLLYHPSHEDYKKYFVEIKTSQGIRLNFVLPITQDQIDDFKKNFDKASELISKSPVNKASKNRFAGTLTYTDMYIGNTKDLGGNSNSNARYDSFGMNILYYLDSNDDKPPYVTLIHEIAHKLHDDGLGYGNTDTDFYELYYWANYGEELECKMFTLPKLGDPLSNLREDWWTVRLSSKDYILTSIDNDIFTYSNSQGKTIELTKKDISKRIRCPSEYGRYDQEEYFAEMVTLITLGKVKPSQKELAKKFLSLIRKKVKS